MRRPRPWLRLGPESAAGCWPRPRQPSPALNTAAAAAAAAAVVVHRRCLAAAAAQSAAACIQGPSWV
jgi:hypothetical protein